MKKYLKILSLTIITSIFLSCASNPYAETNKVYRKNSKTLTKQLNTFPPEYPGVAPLLNYGEHWAGTTNFNLRKPNYVILHHTAQDSTGQTISTFTSPKAQVSSHYVIGKDGKIFHMLNDYYRAWHAGAGKWGNDTDLNSASIGIELDNNGFEAFSLQQIISLKKLLEVLKERYNIPAANFIGHSDIAPSRKVDPNVYFPWKELALEGYGLWYDEEVLMEPEIVVDGIPEIPEASRKIPLGGTNNDTLTVTEDVVYAGVDPELALRIIGYDTSDLQAAIKAFELHFVQKDIDGFLSAEDLKILNNLYKKYM